VSWLSKNKQKTSSKELKNS